MDPSIWGPACWRLVFTACFKLPPRRCIDMFDALRYVLPCVHCRRSYRMYLQRLPPEAAIQATVANSAAKYCWTIKDYVNGKLGAGPLPFSLVCARHEVFSAPVSRMDVVDLLCCMATQVEDDDQVRAYETFATVMGELVEACGEILRMHVPLEQKYRSPPTLWLHAQKLKNQLCTELGQPTLTRDGMLTRYRREAPTTTSTTVTQSRTTTNAAKTTQSSRTRTPSSLTRTPSSRKRRLR